MNRALADRIAEGDAEPHVADDKGDEPVGGVMDGVLVPKYHTNKRPTISAKPTIAFEDTAPNSAGGNSGTSSLDIGESSALPTKLAT